MPADDINYRFTENEVVYDFYDVFVPAEIFREPSLWTWGRNNLGQLGVNDITSRSTPVTTILGGTNWKSVSGGSFHTSAIKTDGTFINDDSVSTTISNSAYTNIVATSNGTTLSYIRIVIYYQQRHSMEP